MRRFVGGFKLVNKCITTGKESIMQNFLMKSLNNCQEFVNTAKAKKTVSVKHKMKLSFGKPCQDTLKINIGVILDIEIGREFRNIYLENPSKKYIIDLQGSSGITSSGLGMLLLLRDFSGVNNSNIEIINCRDNILDVFHVTKFFEFFVIPQHQPTIETMSPVPQIAKQLYP